MKNTLTTGNIPRQLTKLTIPMIFGMFSMMAFNLTDTYFVSYLGTDELTALSFTFPVVMVIGSIAMGFSVGVSSVLARFIGQGSLDTVRRITTDSLILAGLIILFFSIVGFFTIEPVFGFLGAPDDIIPLIKEYMTIWYIGIVFIIIPMVGNGAIRATGDMKFPGAIMTTAAVINIILDPVFIFGFKSIPAMGIKGAALASLMTRAITFFASMFVLSVKKKMLTKKIPTMQELFSSWKEILYISVPSIGTNLLVPLTQFLIYKLLAGFGKPVVAGFGVAIRIESFFLLVPMALGSVLGPFVGQNLGARKIHRISTALEKSSLFVLAWGGLLIAVFFFFAHNLGGLFSEKEAVVETIRLYLVIVSFSYGFQALFGMTSFVLNSVKKPLHSSVLQVFRLFVLYLPLAYPGSYLFRETGIFLALLITNFISGGMAVWMVRRVVREL
ncbi:MAG: MATE family efflux transporter [bacterium]|nr:MATE family efflux transporter [bacterium]